MRVFEARLEVGHVLWDTSCQISWSNSTSRGWQFRSRNGDPIANLESAFEPGAHFQNDARGGVTERQWLVETRSHSVQVARSHHDEFWPVLASPDQADSCLPHRLFCKFDDHPLCASEIRLAAVANLEMPCFTRGTGTARTDKAPVLAL
jgi:hypothetical protein